MTSWDMTPTDGHDVDGELEQDGDRWRLRFTRELAHPAETVWQAVTEPRHLEAWFPQRIVGEWTVVTTGEGKVLAQSARNARHGAQSERRCRRNVVAWAGSGYDR